MRGIDSVFKGSAYLLGAVTGVAFMVPVTAGALATGSLTRAAPQAIAIDAFGPDMTVRQAHLVNRSGKGARLDVARQPIPTAASAGVGAPATFAPASAAPVTTPAPVIVNSQPEPAPLAPSRATRTPKGCLSALGVTKSSLSTEELTVCVADASMIGRS